MSACTLLSRSRTRRIAGSFCIACFPWAHKSRRPLGQQMCRHHRVCMHRRFAESSPGNGPSPPAGARSMAPSQRYPALVHTVCTPHTAAFAAPPSSAGKRRRGAARQTRAHAATPCPARPDRRLARWLGADEAMSTPTIPQSAAAPRPGVLTSSASGGRSHGPRLELGRGGGKGSCGGKKWREIGKY